jgi:hypothetical protein
MRFAFRLHNWYHHQTLELQFKKILSAFSDGLIRFEKKKGLKEERSDYKVYKQRLL